MAGVAARVCAHRTLGGAAHSTEGIAPRAQEGGEGAPVQETSVRWATLSPVWDEEFELKDLYPGSGELCLTRMPCVARGIFASVCMAAKGELAHLQ